VECVMKNGKRIKAAPKLPEIQDRAREERMKVPADCARLREPQKYPVTFSDRLQALLRAVHREMVIKQ